MIELLKNRNVVIMWLSRALSKFGDAFETLAFMYLVYELTGSGLAMGTVMIFNTIPNIVISPIAGAVVDRYNKKKIMFYSEMLRGTAILAIPVLMYMNVLQFWHVCVIASVVSIGESFFEPSHGIACRLSVKKEELAQLNSLSTITNSILRIVGYGTSTMLMVAVGKEVIFIFDAITFFVSGIALTALKLPKIEKGKIEKVKDMFDDIIVGAKYLFNKKIILVLISGIFVVSVVSVPLTQFIPMLVKEILNLTPQWAGSLFMVVGVGQIVGMLLFQRILKSKIRLSHMTGMIFILLGILSAGIVYMGSAITGGVLFFTMAAGGIIISTWSFTMIQTSCEVEYLGRVGAAVNMVILASAPLAGAATGVGIDFIGIGNIIKISSVLYVISGIIIYFKLKKYEKIEDSNEEIYEDAVVEN